MKRYYFDVADGFRDADLEGTELPGAASARAYAAAFAAQIIADDPQRLWDRNDLRIEVSDENRNLIATIVVLAIDSSQARRVDRGDPEQDDIRTTIPAGEPGSGSTMVPPGLRSVADIPDGARAKIEGLARNAQRKQRTIEHAISVISSSMDHHDIARSIMMLRFSRRHMTQRDIFNEPAWDILLAMYVAEGEGKPFTVHNAMRASGSSEDMTRIWIEKLEGVYLRTDMRSTGDGHVQHLSLLDRAIKEMDAVFRNVVANLMPI